MTPQEWYRHWAQEALDDSWKDDAACKGKSHLFFTETSASVLAKQVCTSCPVREECLNYAHDMGETMFVWGGETPEERRRNGRLTQKRVCAECGGSFRTEPHTNRRFCSSACRNRMWMRERRAV